MTFLYYYRVPLPDPRADAIQVVNTCAGIARSGPDVDLHVERFGSASAGDCLAWYGVPAPAADGAGTLRIFGIGPHWSWPLFPWKSARALRAAPKGSILFVREVRPYVPGLIARARAQGVKVIFEAHNVSEALVREKEARASAGAQARPAGAAPAGGVTFSLLSEDGRRALKLVGEEEGHTHGDPHHVEPEAPPPNLDQTPAPPPAPSADSAAARRLRKKADERATLERAILQAADGLICTQRATLEGLRHLLSPGVPATVLGNGTQLPPARPAPAGAIRDIDVLYCGSLKPWKGVDTLVAAMQTLLPFRLTVVGPGTRQDVDRLRQAALSVGMVERLTILPPVRPSEVWDLYARAKVGVIPLPGSDFVEARDFTSPLKLFEMMAAGLPIVCSRLKSLQEYVGDGREALMVTPDDPRPLADGLRKALTDEGLRSGLAAAARARVSEFTWDARGRKIVTFAEQITRS